MTRDIILKRYERGMEPEQIAAVDDLSLEYVEEVISSSGVKPVDRKNSIKRDGRRKSVVTDDEIKRRLSEGETRQEIETDFGMKNGALIKRIRRIEGTEDVGTRGPKPKFSDEEVIRFANEGKTLMEILNITGGSHSSVSKRLKRLEIYEQVRESSADRGRKKHARKPSVVIDLERVNQFLQEGITLPEIAKLISVKYATLRARVNNYPELKALALQVYKDSRSNAMKERHAANREVAATTETGDFFEHYTIAHLSKEETPVTEAISEVKQQFDQDKWVHFIASQIAEAKVKAKFDLVEKDGKLIKQTEVRFVIEEEMR